MRLNNIKQEPLRVIAYIIFTLVLFYLAIGSFMPAVTMTFLCTWICMMPRLTHENSYYKDKLPKFLFKKDFINIFIRVLIPLGLGALYFMEFIKANQTFATPIVNILMLSIPFVMSLFHHLILSKYESEHDWIMPFVCSTLTVFGMEFAAGNLLNLFKNLFPMFFGIEMNIYVLWTFMVQVALIYSMFRILSILLVGRTFAMSFVSLLFILFGTIQHYYTSILGVNFNVMDFINIKDEIALLKILVTENLDVVYLIKVAAIWILITIIAFLFSKGSTTYDLPTRFKSMVCGVIILAATVVLFSVYAPTMPESTQPSEKEYGYTFYMMDNITQKTEFSEEWKEKILKERCALFGEEMPKEDATNTTPPAESTPGETTPEGETPEGTTPEETTPTNPGDTAQPSDPNTNEA